MYVQDTLPTDTPYQELGADDSELQANITNELVGGKLMA